MGARAKGMKELSEDLRKAVENVIPDAKKVTGKGALNIKRTAQRIIKAASHRGYLPHYPRSITYEVKATGTFVSSEIGPESEKMQGGLGPLLEYGSRNNAAIPHLGPGLDLEENTYFGYMEEIGLKLLEGQRGPDGPVVDPGGG